VHGNALRLDWNEVLPAERCSYLLGNPPFVGKQHQDAQQKADVAPIYARLEGGGVLDFVAAWYIKAADYAQLQPNLQVGFVSTNSIVQGEQVGVLWSWMRANGMHINFAHQTFRWDNEASGKAAVHCVIIGFAAQERTEKLIFEYAQLDAEPLAVQTKRINPYLVDADDVFLPSRRQGICSVPPVIFGSMPNDGGHLFLDDVSSRRTMDSAVLGSRRVHQQHPALVSLAKGLSSESTARHAAGDGTGATGQSLAAGQQSACHSGAGGNSHAVRRNPATR